VLVAGTARRKSNGFVLSTFTYLVQYYLSQQTLVYVAMTSLWPLDGLAVALGVVQVDHMAGGCRRGFLTREARLFATVATLGMAGAVVQDGLQADDPRS